MAVARENSDWWHGAIIYQIYPRSFADQNGDGIGDLAGIIAHLPHIASLGVDAIWISPFFKSPMRDFGYDVADYCAVDPLFGTLNDFRALISQAHALGLKVIIDQVLSHSSDQHPWFIESRGSIRNAKADWYVWANAKPDGSPPNNWLSVFGGPAWSWDTRRCQYYLHNFLACQPDLNFHNPAVQAAQLANLRFWLELGVDGFRLDACNYHFHDRQLRDNPPAKQHDGSTVALSNPYGYQAHLYDKTRPENLIYLQQIRRLLDKYGAVSVGEVGDDNSLAVMADYTKGGDKLHMAYSFDLLTEEFSARHIRKSVEKLEAQIGDGWACWSVGNHDVPRVLTRWGKNSTDPQLPRTLLAMLLCLRGSACLYQGDELGLPEADIPFAQLQDPYGIAMWPEFKGRDGCRTPIPWAHEEPNAGFSSIPPWLPIPAAHLESAVDLQNMDPQSLLRFYRQFIAWRHNQPTLRQGDIMFLETPEPILAFLRTHPDGQQIICLFNLGPESRQLLLPPICVHAKPMTGHGLTGARIKGQQLYLDGYGALIAAWHV